MLRSDAITYHVRKPILFVAFGAFGGDFYGSLGIPHWVRSIAQAAAGSHPSPLVQGVRAMCAMIDLRQAAPSAP